MENAPDKANKRRKRLGEFMFLNNVSGRRFTKKTVFLIMVLLILSEIAPRVAFSQAPTAEVQGQEQNTQPVIDPQTIQDNIAKSVQEKLEENRRKDMSKQQGYLRLVRGLVYGSLAILVLIISVFKKRKRSVKK